MTKYVSVEKLKDMGIDIETISGKNIADAIGAEYVD